MKTDFSGTNCFFEALVGAAFLFLVPHMHLLPYISMVSVACLLSTLSLGYAIYRLRKREVSDVNMTGQVVENTVNHSKRITSLAERDSDHATNSFCSVPGAG